MAAVGLLTGLGLVGCGQVTSESGEVVAIDGPVLAHVQPPGPFVDGVEIQLGATATDEDGVSRVTMYYLPDGTPTWASVDLEQSGSSWLGSIPASHVLQPGVSYYFKAIDNSPYQGTSLLPAEGEDAPYYVEVQVQGRGMPWIEDFEGAATGATVYDLEWTEWSEGFPGYPWDVTSADSMSGSYSVSHLAGIDGTDQIIDWLISPAIDLSTEEDIQISWYELGQDVDKMEAGGHSLWISTGSPDPADGEFQLVSQVPAPPEQSWERSDIYELTEWAGSRVAYLAWKYVGTAADDWVIDDVEVRRLAPDLHLVDYSWSVLEPGGSGTLTVEIANQTRIDASGVVLTPSMDATAGSFEGNAVLGDIAGLSSVVTELALTVDPSHPDNAYLPVTLTATDGTDTWEWDLTLVVGEVSLGRVSLTTDVLGYVVATVGVGDPDAPDITVPVVADVLDPGTYSYTLDVTDYFAWLPPAAGPTRWWLQVDSTSPGSVGTFDLSYDGSTYSASGIGKFEGEVESVFWLPSPPDPAVQSQTTTPAQVAPGDTVSLLVSMVNNGEQTVGQTSATLTTTDPDVTILTPDPMEISASGWATGAVVNATFEFQVSADHLNSRDLEFTIVVTDTVESVETTTAVAVPWPVLGLRGTIIDDDDNDVLDAGDTANIEVELINVGDLPTFGSLACTMAIAGGSAPASMTQDYGTFGLLNVGEVDDENDYELVVGGGAMPGDDLELLLACADDEATYDVPVSLEIGVPPWQWVDDAHDDYDDAVDDYTFDIVGGEYRSDGSTLDIILESAEPYTSSITFIEAWMLSNGADYEWYQLVSQSGLGTLRGYNDGVFTTLSHPVVTELDETHLMISMDLGNMGLAIDGLDVGFAAGFCADTYFCDHYPDGWGDPYQTGMVVDLWYALSW